MNGNPRISRRNLLTILLCISSSSSSGNALRFSHSSTSRILLRSPNRPSRLVVESTLSLIGSKTTTVLLLLVFSSRNSMSAVASKVGIDSA